MWGLRSIRFKSSKSSRQWLERQTRDSYTKESRASNYRSRAAFKLIELDDRFKLLNKSTKNIVDLGFAPGAWTQVILERSRQRGLVPRVIGVDLINCSPPDGATFLQGDILSRETHREIRSFFHHSGSSSTERPVDLIVSDMMMNTSGVGDNDHFASMELCDGAIVLACSLLCPGGSLVMKFYTGKEDQLLAKRMQFMFEKVYRMKPDACRLESREMYIIGRRLRDEFTPQQVFSTEV